MYFPVFFFLTCYCVYSINFLESSRCVFPGALDNRNKILFPSSHSLPMFLLFFVCLFSKEICILIYHHLFIWQSAVIRFESSNSDVLLWNICWGHIVSLAEFHYLREIIKSNSNNNSLIYVPYTALRQSVLCAIQISPCVY